MSAEVEYFLIL